MKKILLSITVSLFSFFALTQSVWAIDLSGEWSGAAREKVIVKQSGNTFSVETDDPKYSGIVGLKGTVAGNTFTGQWYGTAEDCPNLAGYVPARGTISESKIEVKIDSFKYNPKTCVKTRDYEDSYSFARETVPTMTPQVEKKESPARTETEVRFASLPNPVEWPDPRDIIFDYLVKETARFNVRTPGYWEIKPEDFVITRGAPKPEGGNIWIVEPRTKVWIQAKGQNEYKPLDFNTTVEPGSYIKAETPVDFWVEGVGLIQLRPGPSGSGMFAVEEINEKISPFLLLGEMEIKYGKPIEEETQKPIDWEQIKFKVKTPNSSVTVSRTHYLVRYDEKEDETTVVVLEGEVEVAPNVGRQVTVMPKNGEPGVVVIIRKPSIVKLILVGAVLVTIIVLIYLKFPRKNVTIKKKK